MFPTLLIVDDEPSILQSLGGLLSDEGFVVTTAANGYEALKIIEAESPDLVLLDIWMPGIDGIETLKEIKKENPNIQVIIITGHGFGDRTFGLVGARKEMLGDGLIILPMVLIPLIVVLALVFVLEGSLGCGLYEIEDMQS